MTLYMDKIRQRLLYAVAIWEFVEQISHNVWVAADYVSDTQISIIHQIAKQVGGSTAKRIESGGISYFESVENSLKFARQIIERTKNQPLPSSSTSSISGLRVGIHYGPATLVKDQDRYDLIGITVSIAAHTAALGDAGTIVLTSDAHDRFITEQQSKTRSVAKDSDWSEIATQQVSDKGLHLSTESSQRKSSMSTRLQRNYILSSSRTRATHR